MCNLRKDYNSHQELHKHDGTKNYEVSSIFKKEFEILELYLDTVSKQLNIAGRTNPIYTDEIEGGRKKISALGEVLDNGPGYHALKDGTLEYYDSYFNWIINGDKSEYGFKNPLNENEQKDSEIWLEKFLKLYNQATYIYESAWNYRFKVSDIWYKMDYNQDIVNDEFVKKHPPIENKDVRLLELRDLRSGKMDKDTTLVNIIGYQETDSEDGGWFNPISYSAGNYFIELYMPLGDTIKIKRHGSMGINMQFYKMPVTQGGRNDVVFIVQEPNEMYPDKEFGGMYVVRPRNQEQEEYGIHKSSFDSFSSEYGSGKANIDMETTFLRPMKD